MALIEFGAGVVGMAGSIAGTTFARNRSGAYARARTKPINPNTAAQVAVRSALAFLTDQWANTLTAVQRAAWNLYAANVIMKNRLGQAINLSGFNHYIRSNSNLKRIATTLVQTGPTIFDLPEQDPTFAITASEGTQLISVTFDDTMPWAAEDDAFMFVFCGTPQNPQINFFNGPWKLGTNVPGDNAVPITSPQTYTAPFVVTENQKIWNYARIVRADGRLSETFRADVFVSA